MTLVSAKNPDMNDLGNPMGGRGSRQVDACTCLTVLQEPRPAAEELNLLSQLLQRILKSAQSGLSGCLYQESPLTDAHVTSRWFLPG